MSDKNIRISSELHARLAEHAKKSRRTMKAEVEYALEALVEGRLWTEIYVRSENESEAVVTIVISVSADGGDDFEVVREAVGDGMLVSHSASLRNAPRLRSGDS